MTRRHAWTVALAVVIGFALLLVGCSGQSPDQPGGKVKLTVATFGDFGYEPLFAEYEQAHPNIKVDSRITDFDTHHKGLATQLAAGRGAADVVAIEELYIPQYRQAKGKFVNLADYGAKDLESQWAPWKWEQGVTDGGGDVLGLGTDMGGLALCYRRDLFAAAGLPADRVQVAKLMPTWQAYAEAADRFTAATPDVKFADSAGAVFGALLNQAPEGYFARADDSFIADRNPNVRQAFDLAGNIAAKGQTANVTPFTQTWNVAIKQGSFATMACPAWMLTQIREAGGEANKGKWDVATIPGGGGNQGGSFLTVPKQSKHPKEAYDLARWLTAPAQQKKLFLSDGILPSEPSVYRDPSVIAKTDPYFSNAPVGQIFAASADKLRPSYRGLQEADVRPEFGRALGRVEEKKQTVAEAWDEAVRKARDLLK
jgi:cellobiose transport system substrate-binding protein